MVLPLTVTLLTRMFPSELLAGVLLLKDVAAAGRATKTLTSAMARSAMTA